MKSQSQIPFGSQLVSPWSATPYSDAINRGGSASEGTVSGRKTRIKRPMNGFMVWSQTKRRQLSAENPGLHNAEISRRLGQLWLQMTEEDRLPFMEEAERLRVLHSRQYPGYKYQPRKRKAPLEVVEDERRRAVEPLPGCVKTLDDQTWNEQLDEPLWKKPTLRSNISPSHPSLSGPQGFLWDWENAAQFGSRQPSFEPPSSLGNLPSPIEAKPWPRSLHFDYPCTTAWKGSGGRVTGQPIPPETTNWSGEEGFGVVNFDLTPGSEAQYSACSDFTSGGGSPCCSRMTLARSVSTTSGSFTDQDLQLPTSSHLWTHPANQAADSWSVSSSTGSYQDRWEIGSAANDNWGHSAADRFTSTPKTFEGISLPDNWNSNDDLPGSAASFCNYATNPDPFVSWLINFYDVELTNPCSAVQ